MFDPASYDDEGEWMSACVPTVLEDGTADDQEAAAICMNMWRNKSAPPTGRAYATFRIKAVVNEDQRVIEGVASTPAADRVGDVLEPRGATFDLPMPLLWQHRQDEPVGHVESVDVTDDGIKFRARLAKIEEPGGLRDTIERAWQAIKARLVRGVSVGFMPREWSMLDSGGYRFIDWEWTELSLVTIPANVDASISVIKSIDRKVLAASGEGTSVTTPPGVTGSTLKPVRLKIMDAKTFADQIRDIEAARGAKSARMAEIMQTASEAGRSTDEAEQDEFDALDVEVKQLDADLKRFRILEQHQKVSATPVGQPKTVSEGSDARGGQSIRVSTPKEAPGIQFARVAKCIGLAQGNLGTAAQIAGARYPGNAPVLNVLKAAVAAGTTDSASWTGALVGDETSVFADFVAYLRPMTIIGKFGNDGVPALRRVPFRVPLISQTGAGAGYWVGEAAAKPLTSFDFSRTTLSPLKVANIAVVSEEVLRDSSPSAESLLRDQLAEALAARLDTDFIDPTKTAAAGVSPASITNGVSLAVSAGNTADNVREDVLAVMRAFAAANNPLSSGVWIMTSQTALALSIMQNPLGQPEFAGMGMTGGRFFGMPVVASEYIATNAGASPGVTTADVYLVNAGDIYLADDDGITVDMSREASLEMSTTPTQYSATGSPAAPVASTSVSLWQTNSVGFRAERTINWAARRSGAVAGVDNVAWGA